MSYQERSGDSQSGDGFRERRIGRVNRNRFPDLAVLTVMEGIAGLLALGSTAARAQLFPVAASPDVTILLGSETVEDQEEERTWGRISATVRQCPRRDRLFHSRHGGFERNTAMPFRPKHTV